MLDQCNLKHDQTKGVIRAAKKNKHMIVVLFVNAKPSVCKSRGKPLKSNVWRGCFDDLQVSLPKYKSASDRFIVVDNNGECDLSEVRGLLCQYM